MSELPLATPGCRTASVGIGGGGMSCASDRMRGIPLEGCWPPARCALLSAGNDGGTSSSPWTVEESSSSSPSVEMVGTFASATTVGGSTEAGCSADSGACVKSQLRRYEVIVPHGLAEKKAEAVRR